MNRHLDHATDLGSLMRAYAEDRGDQTAVTFVAKPGDPSSATALTYRQLDEHARRIAAWLSSRREPGERVMLLHPVGLEFVKAFYGCVYAGLVAVPAPIPGRYPHERRRVRSIALDSGATQILTDARHEEGVRAWAEDENLGQVPICATDTHEFDAPTTAPAAAEPSTLLLLQYTSGSTGDPKGVQVSHGNLIHNIQALGRGLGFDDDTRFGGWIPLYHDMGLMGQLLPGLVRGSQSVLMSPTVFVKRPHLWLRLIDDYQIGFSAAPDFAYDLCRRRITDAQIEGLDLSRWTHAANGSEPVQADTIEGFVERFSCVGLSDKAPCPCYGLAEATVFVSGRGKKAPRLARVSSEALQGGTFIETASDEITRRLVSCGRVGDYDLRIVDPDTGDSLADGKVGEIWLRGPSVASGYWKRPQVNAETFQAVTAEGEAGFLRTGDLGCVDGGEIFITGRIKDLVIHRGRNIYPQDIEHEVRLHYAELRSRYGAVFSVPAAVEGEAMVVTHEVRGALNPDRLREIASGIRQTVAKEFGAPVAGVLLLRPGTVRRTTSGKVERRAMRNLFLAGDLTPIYGDLDESLSGAMKDELR